MHSGKKWRSALKLKAMHSGKFENSVIKHRKIPKTSAGAYIFQGTFLRGLYLEGLIYMVGSCVRL